MNILIVTQYFWPESFRINDLAEGLAERGHNITVLTGKPNYPVGKFFPGYGFLRKGQEQYGNIKIIRSPLIPRGKKNKLQLMLNYISFAFFSSLIGFLKCKKPDVIFVYEPSPITVGLPAVFLKKIKRAPILFWVQDLWPESVVAVGAVRSPKIVKWLEKLVKFIYARCDLILTTSLAYFDSIKKYDVSDHKLRYFPQTAEKIYSPVHLSEDASEIKMFPAGFRIMFAGNIGIAQDPETIVAAANHLRDYKDIKWLLFGDGSRREWLQSEIERCQLQETVYWFGQHPVDSMPRFFSQADALLVILKKTPVFSLTIPAKIQSYLACAKPIIAVLDGEGRRVVEEAGAGLTVHTEDPHALAQTVLKMYQMDAEERKQMGYNGKVYFDEHFERDVLLNRLETWMCEAVEGVNKT